MTFRISNLFEKNLKEFYIEQGKSLIKYYFYYVNTYEKVVFHFKIFHNNGDTPVCKEN